MDGYSGSRVNLAPLEPIRVAVALTHCLPDCSLELSSDDSDDRLLVGFSPEADVTPCRACELVTAAMRTSAEQLGTLLGLGVGVPRSRLRDELIDDSHVGLGVYRFSSESAWGYLFATLLSPTHVRALVQEARVSTEWLRASGAAEWRLFFDEGLAVTVCSGSFPRAAVQLLPEAEQLALDLARRCLVDELIAEIAPLP